MFGGGFDSDFVDCLLHYFHVLGFRLFLTGFVGLCHCFGCWLATMAVFLGRQAAMAWVKVSDPFLFTLCACVSSSNLFFPIIRMVFNFCRVNT